MSDFLFGTLFVFCAVVAALLVVAACAQIERKGYDHAKTVAQLHKERVEACLDQGGEAFVDAYGRLQQCKLTRKQ